MDGAMAVPRARCAKVEAGFFVKERATSKKLESLAVRPNRQALWCPDSEVVGDFGLGGGDLESLETEALDSGEGGSARRAHVPLQARSRHSRRYAGCGSGSGSILSV